MLLQSDKTVAPPGVRPDFIALADQARKHAIPNEWVKIPASEITIGLENDGRPNRDFVWDNEKPGRKIHVAAFEAKSRAITNADYALYLKETNKDKIPASWTASAGKSHQDTKDSVAVNALNPDKVYMNGDSSSLMDAFMNDKAVRTVYGPVSLAHALDWPAIASYDELAGCAKWMNGRIPTMEETQSIYRYVDQLNSKESSGVSARTIPAVNGYVQFSITPR